MINIDELIREIRYGRRVRMPSDSDPNKTLYDELNSKRPDITILEPNKRLRGNIQPVVILDDLQHLYPNTVSDLVLKCNEIATITLAKPKPRNYKHMANLFKTNPAMFRDELSSMFNSYHYSHRIFHTELYKAVILALYGVHAPELKITVDAAKANRYVEVDPEAGTVRTKCYTSGTFESINRFYT